MGDLPPSPFVVGLVQCAACWSSPTNDGPDDSAPVIV